MYTTEARLQNVGLRHMSANVSKDCVVYKKGHSIATRWHDYTLGIRRSSIKCVHCSVYLCVKHDTNCWIDWHPIAAALPQHNVKSTLPDEMMQFAHMLQIKDIQR